MTAQDASVDKIIALIYSAAHDAAKWRDVVMGLRDHFNTTQACFVRFGPGATAADQFRAKEDPYFEELYMREFANDMNLVTKVLAQLPLGEVFGEHNYINRDDLRKERLWKEWMAPQDMYYPLGCKLYADGSSLWFVSLDRGQKAEPYNEEEIAEFTRLVPHFINAIKLGLEVAANRTPSATLAQVQLGVIVVDEEARVLFANDFAETVLTRKDSALSRNSHGYITTADRAKAAELTDAISEASVENAGPAKHLLLQSPDENDARDLSVSVSSLGNETDIFASKRKVMLSVRELGREAPPDFDEKLRMIFGLGAQEARVAAKLAYGQTVKEVAESLSVSMPTVRTHLASLFRKTKTAQQSQLVALLRASLS